MLYSVSRHVVATVTALGCVLGWSSRVLAQAPPVPADTVPSETVKAQTVTKGETEIATGGFVTSMRPADDDPRVANDLNIGAGGLFSAGNARNVALTAVIKGRVRRDENQFGGAATANFARAGKTGTSTDTTIENYQGLLRYDRFISNDLSFFFQTTARRDRFQGLDMRLNLDPGVAYYFINTKTHRLQFEIGYDYQHDIRRDESLVQAVPAGSPPGTLAPPPLDKTSSLHNARLFLGYENKLRKEVSFVASIEYLQNFADTDRYRLIADIGLKSSVSDHFSLATTYTARYENRPLPGVVSLDSIASINLVYSFF